MWIQLCVGFFESIRNMIEVIFCTGKLNIYQNVQELMKNNLMLLFQRHLRTLIMKSQQPYPTEKYFM